MKSLLLFAIVAALHVCNGLPAKSVLPFLQKEGLTVRVKNTTPRIHPYESGRFEGDIIYTAEQVQEMKNPNTKTGMIDPRYNWPNAVVYYQFAPGAFSQSQIDEMLNAFYNIEYYTCVRFEQRTNQNDYIYVKGDNDGCWSYVGRIGGRQELNLQTNGCMYFSTIVHEFMHAIGFQHMQSATERDEYIRILWENIGGGMEYNFESYPASMISQFGYPYDLESVMHYTEDAFSFNGLPTMQSLTSSPIRPDDDIWTSWDSGRINNKYCS